MKNKSLFEKVLSSIAIFSLLLWVIGPEPLYAANLTAISDTMTREIAATKSLHKIVFTSTTAMVAAGTVTINFATFTGTPVIADVQICHGAGGTEHGTAVVTGGTACGATDETIQASNGASTIWGAVWTGTSLALTAPSGTWTNLISIGQKMTVYVTAANITNPAVSTPAITITNSNGDSGTVTVPIIDNDQVTISATVNETITFDLDTYNTAVTSTETGSPYSVALGTLSSGSVSGSTEGGASTPNAIWFDLATNASGGAIVTVASTNAGLKSTSTPADIISSSTATMTAGTANYGICVKTSTATTGTLNKVAPFTSATCTTTPAGNTVGAVTAATQTIINSNSLPVAAGRVEIMVDAAISTTTPAHTDYSDLLNFEATGTF